MAQSFYFREQAESCRRLARDSTDPALRDGVVRLTDEYAAWAGDLENTSENDDATAWHAGSDDTDAD
jgi:predicted nucleic acid-binding Zn ribbon protein